MSIRIKEIFPNSYIINIDEMSNVDIELITLFLKSYDNIDKQYLCRNHNYYYLEKDEIVETNLDGVCNIMRKVLKK